MGQKQNPDFDTIYSSFHWEPIRGCPGRYILREKKRYTLVELVGGEVCIRTYRDKSRDIVHIAALKGGGMISYQKKEGWFIHTLGNSGGFARKLKMMGIETV